MEHGLIIQWDSKDEIKKFIYIWEYEILHYFCTPWYKKSDLLNEQMSINTKIYAK